MDFFCLPILCGCSTRVKPEGDQVAHLCPRCNNASVIQAKKKVWFELFCVPVVPMSSKHIWVCGVCQFQAKQQPGWQPALPGQYHQNGGGHMMMQGPPPGGYQGPSPGAQSGAQAGYPGHQQGYQPAYR